MSKPFPPHYKKIYTDWKNGMQYSDLTEKYNMSRAGIINALYKYKLRHGLMLEVSNGS